MRTSKRKKEEMKAGINFRLQGPLTVSNVQSDRHELSISDRGLAHLSTQHGREGRERWNWFGAGGGSDYCFQHCIDARPEEVQESNEYCGNVLQYQTVKTSTLVSHRLWRNSFISTYISQINEGHFV